MTKRLLHIIGLLKLLHLIELLKWCVISNRATKTVTYNRATKTVTSVCLLGLLRSGPWSIHPYDIRIKISKLNFIWIAYAPST